MTSSGRSLWLLEIDFHIAFLTCPTISVYSSHGFRYHLPTSIPIQLEIVGSEGNCVSKIFPVVLVRYRNVDLPLWSYSISRTHAAFPSHPLVHKQKFMNLCSSRCTFWLSSVIVTMKAWCYKRKQPKGKFIVKGLPFRIADLAKLKCVIEKS